MVEELETEGRLVASIWVAELRISAIIETTVAGRRTLIVLYPIDDLARDAWNLGSAYQI
jgi:hypothetical protein